MLQSADRYSYIVVGDSVLGRVVIRRAITAGAAATVVVTLAGVPLLAEPAQGDAPSPGCPQVVSHATGMLLAPENTVAGINAVAATGGTAVEMDVQWSSSGFPVLMHDTTVNRTTNGTGTPASLGLSQLTALLAQDYAPWKTDPRYATTKVPYGWDFMNAAADAGMDVLLDIHATPTAVGMDKLTRYIDTFGWRTRTILMGSDAHVIAMRALQPGLRYALIEYNPATTIRRGESLQQLGVEAYVVPARDVSPAAVTYWHSYAVRVFTWSSDSPAIDVPSTWSRVAGAGVDRLITNEHRAAAAALAPLCPAPPSRPPSSVPPSSVPPPTVQPTTTVPSNPPPTRPSPDPPPPAASDSSVEEGQP